MLTSKKVFYVWGDTKGTVNVIEMKFQSVEMAIDYLEKVNEYIVSKGRSPIDDLFLYRVEICQEFEEDGLLTETSIKTRCAD